MPGKREAQEDVVPQQPQMAPPSFSGGADHSFTLQAIMELHKGMGEVNSNLTAIRSSVDGLKGKVDDLVGWKHKILGGAAVLGAVCVLLGFLVSKFSSYVTIGALAPQQVAPLQPPAPAVSTAPTKRP